MLGRGSPGECRIAVRGEGGGEVETMPCGSLLPVRVAGAPSLSRLASSSGHTCGVAADGAAYCWGRAGHGQLGHGSIERVDSAVRVTAATAVREIAPLGNSTCALDAEGGLWCWGQAEYGRLGLDSAPDRCPVRWSAGAPVRNVPCALRPQRVAPGTAFRALASGATSGCAIATGGVLWCWPGGGEAAAIGLSRDSTSVVPRRLWPERRFRAAARRDVHVRRHGGRRGALLGLERRRPAGCGPSVPAVGHGGGGRAGAGLAGAHNATAPANAASRHEVAGSSVEQRVVLSWTGWSQRSEHDAAVTMRRGCRMLKQ